VPSLHWKHFDVRMQTTALLTLAAGFDMTDDSTSVELRLNAVCTNIEI